MKTHMNSKYSPHNMDICYENMLWNGYLGEIFVVNYIMRWEFQAINMDIQYEYLPQTILDNKY